MANEKKFSHPSEALSARMAGPCDVAKRTRTITIVNESAWGIEIAFQQLIQDHDLPPPAGYLQSTGVYHTCDNIPARTNCVTDPCVKVGKPIMATRAQCSAKFVYPGQPDKDINFPDIVTEPGKYIVNAGWRVHSFMAAGGAVEVGIEQFLAVETK